MKSLSFIVLLAMALTMVSCGNKNNSGGSSSNNVKNSLSVQDITGYIDTNNPYYFVVNNTQYQIVDTAQAMKNAYAQGQSSGVIVQGITRYRVKIVGVFQTTGTAVSQQYPYNNGQQVSGPSVQVSSAVWSRL